MHWRCAYPKPKRARPSSGPVECDLGPQIPSLRAAQSVEHRPLVHISAAEIVLGGIVSVIGVTLLCAVLFLLFMAAMVLTSRPSKAHGPAEWIQRGQYKNAAGELCCGERDCFELSDKDVKITSAGYFIASIKETIPFSEAAPSPDGRYWRCQWGGMRKCFFAPPSAT